RRGASLAGSTGPDLAAEVARRGVVAETQLRRLGVPVDADVVAQAGVLSAGGWLLSRERADLARETLHEVVLEHQRSAPLSPGPTVSMVAELLDLPTVELARALVQDPLRVEAGHVTSGRPER